MSDAVKHLHPHPAEGGAYERQADGTLVLIERTAETAATAEEVPPVEPPPATAASVRKRNSA